MESNLRNSLQSTVCQSVVFYQWVTFGRFRYRTSTQTMLERDQWSFNEDEICDSGVKFMFFSVISFNRVVRGAFIPSAFNLCCFGSTINSYSMLYNEHQPGYINLTWAGQLDIITYKHVFIIHYSTLPFSPQSDDHNIDLPSSLIKYIIRASSNNNHLFFAIVTSCSPRASHTLTKLHL